MFYADKKGLCLALIVLLFLVTVAYAEDTYNQYLNSSMGWLKNGDDGVGKFFFSVFPGFEESLNGILKMLDGFFPLLKDWHWVYYLIIFFLMVSALIKVWEENDQYIVNSLLGVTMLLVFIHVFGVHIKVTVLRFLLTAVLGMLGVLIVLGLNYFNIYL